MKFSKRQITNMNGKQATEEKKQTSKTKKQNSIGTNQLNFQRPTKHLSGDLSSIDFYLNVFQCCFFLLFILLFVFYFSNAFQLRC